MKNAQSTHETHIEAIRAEAYRLYLASDRMERRDLENWILAERIVKHAERDQDLAGIEPSAIHFPLNANALPGNTPHPFSPPNPNENAL
jgi:hypothetical protein